MSPDSNRDYERHTKEVFEGIAAFYRFKNVHSMPPNPDSYREAFYGRQGF
jgi:hypothetical protein